MKNLGIAIIAIVLLSAFPYMSWGCVADPASGNNSPAGNSSPPPADNPSPTSATNNASSPSVAPASTVSAPSSSANSSNGISPPGLPYRTFHPDPCQMRINEKCVNYLGNGFWMIDGRLYDEVK